MSKYTQFGENRKNFIKSSRVRAIYPPFYFCFLSSFCAFLAVIATSRLFAALIAASFVFVEMSLLMMVFLSILPIFSASSSLIIFSTKRSAEFCGIILLVADEYASPAEFASCFSAVLSAALKGVGSVDVPTVCRFTLATDPALFAVAIVRLSTGVSVEARRPVAFSSSVFPKSLSCLLSSSFILLSLLFFVT